MRNSTNTVAGWDVYLLSPHKELIATDLVDSRASGLFFALDDARGDWKAGQRTTVFFINGRQHVEVEATIFRRGVCERLEREGLELHLEPINSSSIGLLAPMPAAVAA